MSAELDETRRQLADVDEYLEADPFIALESLAAALVAFTAHLRREYR